MGFVFLSTSILVLIQALMVKAMQSAPSEEGAEQAEPKPKGRHTFFYIPVFYWGLLTAGLCIYFFVSGGIGNPKKRSNDSYVSTSKKEEEKPKRIINFLNPTADTLYCYIGEPGGNERKEKIGPNTYSSLEVDPGEYLFGAFDLDNNLVYSHADEYEKDQSKYHRVKEKDGKVFYYRIVSSPTPEKTDYDEAWYVMDGKKQLIMIDVTDICFADRTKKDITGVNWRDHIVEEYDPGDLIEPLAGSGSQTNCTVLNLGEDIPTRAKSGKLVYWMTSFSRDIKITDEVIEQKIIGKIFD